MDSDDEVFRHCTVEIEWLIENFTCWTSKVHGRSIWSPDIPHLPGFIAWLHRESVNHFDVVKVTFVFGPFDGDVSFFGSDRSLLGTVACQAFEGPTTLYAPNLMLAMSEEEGHHRGDHVTLRFRFFAPRDDLVTVSMSTTLEVLSDVTATFSRSDLLKGLESDKPKLLLAIRYIRPGGNEEEELVHLELELLKMELICLGMRAVTEGAFRGLAFKSQWDICSHDNRVLDSGVILGAFDDDATSYWTLADSWEDFLMSTGSRFRIRLKFFTGKVTSHVRGGGVWRIESFVFVPESRYSPKPSVRRRRKSHEDWMELVSTHRNHLFTDFKLRCGVGTTIDVHQAVLIARSPVFDSMLSHDMRERSTGSSDIRDIDVPTLEQFVGFLYTGEVDDLREDSAMKLYYAADKYMVSNLKAECAEFLTANLSVSNACDVLRLANRHGDAPMTAAAQNFILNNFGEVFKSETWQSCLKTDPGLLARTVTYFATNGYFRRIFSIRRLE